ncbi:heavy metal-binding domain-containing protein [Kribbella solani]|uniref:YbjQ family protein n=1 Tax=Kribbella solani TaxID=236067 RepID=UPI0029BF5028|nr:heavy metal-binding domain-containing protein [Kribbella solani]MDX3003521.1 heavy metal-binding domain-containing protein [Kribbella solani]
MNQNFPPNQPYPPQQGYQQGPPPGYQGPPPQQQGYQQGPPPQGYGQPGPGYGQAPGSYQPARQNAPHVAPQGSPYPVLVSTMNDLPGYTAEKVFGEVFGLTVRSRDFGSNFTASFRSLGGGEVPEYTQMLAESRHVAVMRMCQMAQQMGANAVLAMRFDCNEIANTMSEVAAYGTAVVVQKVQKDEPPRVQDSKPDEDDANDS